MSILVLEGETEKEVTQRRHDILNAWGTFQMASSRVRPTNRLYSDHRSILLEMSVSSPVQSSQLHGGILLSVKYLKLATQGVGDLPAAAIGEVADRSITVRVARIYRNPMVS